METAALDEKVEKQKAGFPLSYKGLETLRVFHNSHSWI